MAITEAATVGVRVDKAVAITETEMLGVKLGSPGAAIIVRLGWMKKKMMRAMIRLWQEARPGLEGIIVSLDVEEREGGFFHPVWGLRRTVGLEL